MRAGMGGVTDTGRPRRLLCVHRMHRRKGGAEAVYFDHLRLFRERGWTCAEFAMDHPENEPSAWSGYFPSGFDPASGVRAAERLSQALRFVWSSEARRKMAALLDDFRPDVVHVHGLYHQLTPSVLGPVKARGVPLVYTAHDYKPICPAYYLQTPDRAPCERCGGGRQWNCFTRRCMHGSYAVSAVYAADGLVHWWAGSYRRLIDAYVLPSRFMLEKYRAHGFPADRLHLIHNGVDVAGDGAEPAAATAFRERHGARALFLGRLSPEKGCDHLIRAGARAGVPLAFAGAGPEEERLRRLAAETGADALFLGFLDGDALAAAVMAARCVVLPSVTFENAPRAIVEAQARGKPVLASAIGGIPELIADGETGFLAPPGDETALAAALARIHALPAKELERIGGNARRAAGLHTGAGYYDATVALYDRLLAAGAASGRRRAEAWRTDMKGATR